MYYPSTCIQYTHTKIYSNVYSEMCIKGYVYSIHIVKYTATYTVKYTATYEVKYTTTNTAKCVLRDTYTVYI